MNTGKIELQPEQMLTAIFNNLNEHFFKVPKNESKHRFRELERGMQVSFLRISEPNHGELKCELALDHSEFVGKLNFRLFRNALASHLRRIAGKITNKEELNIFTNEQTGDMIYHIPGVVENGDTINILVTGIEQRAVGKATVRLMFLDPDHFSQQE